MGKFTAGQAQSQQGFFGNEFYLSFPNNIIKVYDSSLYIMAVTTTNDIITVQNPRSGYKITRATTANKAIKIFIPRSQWEYPSPVAGPQDAAVVITSQRDMQVIAANSESTSGEMTQLLPAQYLEFGQQYNLAFPHYGQNGKEAQFVIVAIDNGTTTVRIKSSTYIQSFSYNFTINLKKGQAMPLYMTDTSKPNPLVNISVENSCNRVAVFQSLKSVENGSGLNCSGTDMLFEQAWPSVFYGKQYIVPAVPQNNSSTVLITAQYNASNVLWDGIPLVNLNAGESYRFEIPDIKDHFVSCNNPVQVSQTTFSHGCSGHPNLIYGDPALLHIAPAANGIYKTFVPLLTDQFYKHYIKITSQSNAVPNVKINNTALVPTGGWQNYTWLGNSYYTAWTELSANQTLNIESDQPMQAYYYAMGLKTGLATCVGGGFINRNSDFIVDKTQVCDTFEAFNFTAIGDSVSNILWNFGDGNTSNANPISHTYKKTGTYTAQMLSYRTNAYCKADTIEKTITVFRRPPTVLFPDSFPCVGTAVKIEISPQSGSKYQWADGFINLNRTILQNTKLGLTITDSNGCITNDSVKIEFKECNFQHLKLANIFTPNRDGLNDKWIIEHLGYSNINVRIYSRWNQLIYNYNLPADEDWNGTVGNRGFTKCPDGVYFYKIVATNQYDGSTKNISGIIQLIH